MHGLAYGLALALVLGLGSAWAQGAGGVLSVEDSAAPSAGVPITATLRLQRDLPQANTAGQLALADQVQAGTAASAGAGTTVLAELRSNGRHWQATASVQQQQMVGQSAQSRAWFNELAVSGDALGWQWSAGKKIVAWDVGYAFRPNDVVQQEERRTLVDTTPQGRPLLMAERFDLDTAWALVWVNPTHAASALAGDEPALAGRVYVREGAVDWHGFARQGGHTGTSLGVAAAWVASDSVELHASARLMRHADAWAMPATAPLLSLANPWQIAPTGPDSQMLAGGTWTFENHLSLLAEAWWDGTAPSDAQWQVWQGRQTQLAQMLGAAVPASALAGNLAWQTTPFNTSNLRQRSVFVRASWEHEGWQPSLDVLYHPADAGRLWTAALAWAGERVKWQAGVRRAGGPGQSVLAQLPTRQQVYVSAVWAF
jgi:hypothetical protein